jgi:hypothetical protein
MNRDNVQVNKGSLLPPSQLNFLTYLLYPPSKEVEDWDGGREWEREWVQEKWQGQGQGQGQEQGQGQGQGQRTDQEKLNPEVGGEQQRSLL